MKNSLPIPICLGVMILISCNDSIVNHEKPTQGKLRPISNSEIHFEIKEKSSSDTLKLDHFKNLPDDIQGCSCYFSNTQEKFDDQEYLFAADYEKAAYISIDNKLIKLKLVSTNRAPDSFGDHDRKDIYNNENYKVTIDFNYKSSSGDETWWNEGTITIEDNKGGKTVKKIIGECGC